MEFLHRANPQAARIALLPGAWNPPTLAHIALATAALGWAEDAVLVLPRAFPHKEFEGPGPDRRAAWLAACARAAGLSAALSDGGLFIDIARECRASTGAAGIFLVCGCDAAERIVGWDYGPGDSIDRQLEEYELLVAPRPHGFAPPSALAPLIHSLDLAGDWNDVSSTEVRERIRRGAAWTHLVPAEILEDVRAAF
jgi:nicotinic acid mononucleotide adenylyltransferase